ncbi:unnamed protein product [Phaeothamnion confervicola]
MIRKTAAPATAFLSFSRGCLPPPLIGRAGRKEHSEIMMAVPRFSELRADNNAVTKAGGGMEVKEIPLTNILRPLGKTRSNDAAKVERLMESIAEIGQQVPIDVLEVDGRYYGFSGCHRFEAAQRLGMPTIKCRVVKASLEVLHAHMRSGARQDPSSSDCPGPHRADRFMMTPRRSRSKQRQEGAIRRSVEEQQHEDAPHLLLPPDPRCRGSSRLKLLPHPRSGCYPDERRRLLRCADIPCLR